MAKFLQIVPLHAVIVKVFLPLGLFIQFRMVITGIKAIFILFKKFC